MNNDKNLSALVLEHTVFDYIEFHREGFRNENPVEFGMRAIAGRYDETDMYKVTLELDGCKRDEYTLKLSLSGFFSIQDDKLPDHVGKEQLIKNNAVAILMPYLRAEVSLLTSQPEVECVVMPVFNINAMMNQ